MTAVVRALTAARKLIADPADWCRGSRSETRRDGGTRRCALGAIYAIVPRLDPVHQQAVQVLARTAGPVTEHDKHNDVWPGLIEQYRRDNTHHGHVVAAFNNTHDHPAVMKWFSRAIREAKK
jgi:hypothetical protein